MNILNFFKGNMSSNNISMQEFKANIMNDKSFVILDVRNHDETVSNLRIIKGAINIPVGELGNRAGELDKYKDKKIAVVCRSGGRSAVATKILSAKGFNAYNIVGGMIDYYSN